MRLRPDYPIATPRLKLQPVSAADVDDLLGYRGRADVCRYLPFEPMSRQVLLHRLSTDLGRTEISDEGQSLTLAVRRRDDGRVIGDVVLFYRSAKHASGELGYVFAPDAGGQGYATEAAAALLALGFEGLQLHRIIARLDVRNEASARVLRRLGLRQEARFVRNEFLKGEWTDEAVFAMLADEWPQSPAARLLNAG